ncbi:hypothetical protein E2320_000721, partial [Naja naja]
MPTGTESQRERGGLLIGTEAQDMRQEMPPEVERIEEANPFRVEVQGLRQTEAGSQGHSKDSSSGAGDQEPGGEISDKNDIAGEKADESEGCVPIENLETDRRIWAEESLIEQTSGLSDVSINIVAGGIKKGTKKNNSGDRSKKQINKKSGQKSKVEDRFKELSVYFSKEQWAEMGEWEKLRYKNMKHNYDFMIQLGLPTPKPAFMYYARQPLKTANESSESDEEWTPTLIDFQTKAVPEKKKERKKEQNKEISTYRLRKRDRKAYMEINEPNDDDYLDTAAELGLANRATCTLPSGFRIGLSSIPRAGFGVWNERETLTPGIHFGPYEGTRTEEEAAANSGYSWLYHGEIYYRTCKEIQPHSELLVWYGEEYGKELGIKWGSKWKSLNVHKQNSYLVKKQQIVCHQCPRCETAFTCKDYLTRHMKWKHSGFIILAEEPEKILTEKSLPKIRSYASYQVMVQYRILTNMNKGKHDEMLFLKDRDEEAENKTIKTMGKNIFSWLLIISYIEESHTYIKN